MNENLLTTNNDITTIIAAYQDTLKKLFTNLVDGIGLAAGDQAKITVAEQKFTAGLTVVRFTRDKAINLIAIRPAAVAE
jgi:Na+-transporting NADH:ubiquinone oxidoreductase subunit NqrA